MEKFLIYYAFTALYCTGACLRTNKLNKKEKIIVIILSPITMPIHLGAMAESLISK